MMERFSDFCSLDGALKTSNESHSLTQVFPLYTAFIYFLLTEPKYPNIEFQNQREIFLLVYFNQLGMKFGQYSCFLKQ